MEDKNNYRTELERKIKNSFKYKGITIKEGAKLLHMSPSKLHNVFKNHHRIESKTLHQFAQYLKVEIEHIEAMNALKLPSIGKSDKSTSESTSTLVTEVIPPSSNNLIYRFILLLSITLLFALLIYVVNGQQSSDPQVIDYQVSGEDLAPHDLISEQFNPPLYSYFIGNAKIEKLNGVLTMNADLSVIDRKTKKTVITGEMIGTGYYYGDQGSISYKVENSSNGDSWTGVFMLDMPSSGNLKGYWLTSHNDANSKYGFRYSIGNVLGTHCEKNKKSPCIESEIKLNTPK